MNRRSPGLFLSKAIEGFLQYKQAEALSPRTIESYAHDLKLWLEYQKDGDVAKVTTPNLRAYIVYLQTEYKPRRITGGNEKPLSSKTVRNHYISLCAFFHWCADEFQIHNPMGGVPKPKFQGAIVEAFSKEEVAALLKACDTCAEAKTDRRKTFVMNRATGRRDRAIILFLLDTGVRASELCALHVGDWDQKTNKVNIRHGREGGAKGGYGRTVYLGKSAGKALWRYLADREDGHEPTAPMFESKAGQRLGRDGLYQVIAALGVKANVAKCHPHRFRHTMAVNFLRFSGDLLTLQALGGWKTMEVMKIYAKIAEVDIERVHRKSSPVDNMHL
jgi:integrase/recombinase XerD